MVLTMDEEEEEEEEATDLSDDELSDWDEDCYAPSFSPLSSDTESLSTDDELAEDDSDEEQIISQPPVLAEEKTNKTLPSTLPSTPLPSTYSLVGDNIDKSIKPSYMRVDFRNKTLHYFAASDRIDASGLSLTPPRAPALTPKACAASLLPSTDDD